MYRTLVFILFHNTDAKKENHNLMTYKIHCTIQWEVEGNSEIMWSVKHRLLHAVSSQLNDSMRNLFYGYLVNTKSLID